MKVRLQAGESVVFTANTGIELEFPTGVSLVKQSGLMGPGTTTVFVGGGGGGFGGGGAACAVATAGATDGNGGKAA